MQKIQSADFLILGGFEVIIKEVVDFIVKVANVIIAEKAIFFSSSVLLRMIDCDILNFLNIPDSS